MVFTVSLSSPEGDAFKIPQVNFSVDAMITIAEEAGNHLEWALKGTLFAVC